MKKTRPPNAEKLNFIKLKRSTMKKVKVNMKIYAFLIMLSFSTQTNAQYEWAPIGAEWYYCIPELSTGDPRFSYEHYIVEKDTLIEGKACRVVKSDLHTEYFYQDGYKIYYWFNNKFNLIYNFDSQIGDTVIFDFKACTLKSLYLDTTLAVQCVIESIDTTMVNNHTIREFVSEIIPIPEMDYLIWDSKYRYFEKYGYLYNFMETISHPSPGYMFFLRCYDDDDIKFQNPWWAQENLSCDFTLLGIEDKNQANIAKICPNPTDNSIFIELNNQIIFNDIEITILGFGGRKIQEIQSYSYSEQIDVSYLKQGLYFVQITNTHKKTKQILKFIKI